jgi:hypothetical protein
MWAAVTWWPSSTASASRHVADRVGAGGEVDAVGLAGVPVIEPDDLPSPAGEHLHELVRPAGARRRGAHDQEHHRISRVTKELGPQPQVPGINERGILLNHDS